MPTSMLSKSGEVFHCPLLGWKIPEFHSLSHYSGVINALKVQWNIHRATGRDEMRLSHFGAPSHWCAKIIALSVTMFLYVRAHFGSLESFALPSDFFDDLEQKLLQVQLVSTFYTEMIVFTCVVCEQQSWNTLICKLSMILVSFFNRGRFWAKLANGLALSFFLCCKM